MSYTVPNMVLIPQDQTNACWYASTQMVIQWRRERTQSCESGLLDPSEVPAAVAVYKANNGIAWAVMQRYAKMIGLVSLPLQSPMPELVESWLATYGPIWTDGVPVDATGQPAGTGHVVVLSGIRTENNKTELRIHDPWPPNVGNVSWRPYEHLGGILSDGANPNRDTAFLRLP